jgi:signal peptidase II
MPVTISMPFRSGGLLAIATIVLDQLTKWWILTSVMTPPQTIPVTGFFNLVLVYNRGVSFGFLGGAPSWATAALVIFALLLSVTLTIWM